MMYVRSAGRGVYLHTPWWRYAYTPPCSYIYGGRRYCSPADSAHISCSIPRRYSSISCGDSVVYLHPAITR